MTPFKVRSARVRSAAAMGTLLLATISGTLFATAAGAATTESGITHAAYAAGPAKAQPDGGHGCNPDPVAPVHECTAVKGAGLEIKSIQGYADAVQAVSISHVHIEIFYGPGHKKIHDCGQFTLGIIGPGPTCTWHNPHPEKRVKSGNYCTEAWQKKGPHNYSVLSVECIDVHR